MAALLAIGWFPFRPIAGPTSLWIQTSRQSILIYQFFFLFWNCSFCNTINNDSPNFSFATSLSNCTLSNTIVFVQYNWLLRTTPIDHLREEYLKMRQFQYQSIMIREPWLLLQIFEKMCRWNGWNVTWQDALLPLLPERCSYTKKGFEINYSYRQQPRNILYHVFS